jgi:HEAT repeat protein
MRATTVLLSILIFLLGCSNSAPTPSESESPEAEPPEIDYVQVFTSLLNSKDDEERLTGIVGLSINGPQAKPALPALSSLVRLDPNRIIRAQAVVALVYIDPAAEEVLPSLTYATRDKEPDVRKKAMEALSRVGPRANLAVDELIRLLKDPEPELRCAAARALGSIGPGAEKARPFLAVIGDVDEDESVRAMARDAIRWIDDK